MNALVVFPLIKNIQVCCTIDTLSFFFKRFTFNSFFIESFIFGDIYRRVTFSSFFMFNFY